MKPEKTETYERPEVTDYGDLKDLTEGTVFFGTEDGSVKGDPNAPEPHFSQP
jgi:hypothetical protein